MKKNGTVVAAEAWLEGLIHESPTFHAQVEERLVAINIAQNLAALRVPRGLSQTQLAAQLGITPSATARLEAANVELRTFVRVARGLGAQVEVAIRPHPAPRRPRPGRPGRAKKVVAMRKSS